MDGKSSDIRQEQIEKLKELFPEAVSECKIDWEKLRLTLGEDITIDNERYVLNWAGKSDAFRAIQTPTTATLKPQQDQSVDFDKTENVFIEGENLEVLKVLQRSYYGKVKMIYIDPPYNTGNDSFIYPDKFSESKDEYLRRIGDKDEAGYLTKEGFFRKNSKENGQYHSNWLSMMYPRLFLARNLLRDDGVIFISIDDNEVHNLRLMMNEIFGEESFVSQIVWKKTYGGGSKAKHVVGLHEYALCFAKNKEKLGVIELPPDPDAKKYYSGKDEKYETRGPYRTQPLATTSMDERPNLRFPINWRGQEIWPEKQWQWSKERVEAALADDELIITKQSGKWSVRYKQYLYDEQGHERSAKPFSILEGPYTQEGTSEIKEMFGDGKIFAFPKPSGLVKHLLKYAWKDHDAIILDFFAGSGATAQAAMELNAEDGGNRKFILVQLPEKTDEGSEAYKAGYKTIADICRERIRRAIRNLSPNPSPGGEGDGHGGRAENLFKGANPSLFENAHRMRLVDKTEAEDRLWQALRNRKVENCKFRRQHPIGSFILDFYCHEKKLGVEIDGGYHNEQEQKEHDAARTQVINEFGIRVIRFTNEEVLNDIEATVKKISEVLKSNPMDAPLSERRGAGGEAGFKAFTLEPSNFKVWRTDTIENGDDLVKQMDAFADPVRSGSDAEAMAWEILIKSGYELTTKIETLSIEGEKRGKGDRESVSLYSIGGGEVILALEKISQEAIDEVVKMKPKTFICLDRLFAGNDQLKTNTALQLKDAGVEFKNV